ncbi:MAG TPA: AMP-binding protein [Candidatus Coprenecus stercoravium]|uniref:AMP-binding protein n=1 Tax=Candidatus Coprenecus stercoravium TaxID=2840735 RepID=A0A9D2KAC8_9BACT|nr:AMP-binding protein [Candidatus Coprenecus stercoravium]
MDNTHQRSLRALLEFAHSRYQDHPFLYFIDGPGYTYGEFHSKAYETAGLLSRYGMRRGDMIGLLGQNMPNWGAAYFATSAFGMISVPMLPDFSESEIKHILKHSEARALFVSRKLLHKVLDKAMDRLELVICLDDFSIIKGSPCDNPETLPSEEDIQPDDLAAVIYTSGTTGSSKGVMLSHRNLCANLWSTEDVRPSFDWDVWLSLLPLSHTLECSMCLLLPMQAGASVYYMDKAPTPTVLMKALAQVRPTTILSVPLIIEKVYKSSVLPKLTATPLMRLLYSFPPTRKMMNRKAGKQLMEKFGGRIRFFGIGGARLDPGVEKFLIEARFPYAIGYGLTETSPLIAAATPEMVRLGSTGPVVKGVTVQLMNKDRKTGIGEIAVKGDNVTRGYFKNPEATEAAFTEDGWFLTRDLGRLDKDGWLYIKGRSSTTIIGPSGENIYPEEVESVINSHDMVSESLVTSKKGRLTALVHFDKEKLKAFNTQEKLERLKKDLLEYVNQKVSKFSRISEIDPQEEEFEKTATRKIKRYLYDGSRKKDKTSK